jgi:hypothetical protein
MKENFVIRNEDRIKQIEYEAEVNLRRLKEERIKLLSNCAIGEKETGNRLEELDRQINCRSNFSAIYHNPLPGISIQEVFGIRYINRVLF